ncbi:FxSxx-COOH system tetratricopeptide repeat protein [Streptacidiphilus sp. N1-3]|uniref:FxSxx-COOH system tetratricopeptide repeat protein n=1 Tax=Streptacidiphilus alkalitolerans TaxID=3342712 RepID=A0ABV6X5R0_9ACTN
MTERQAEGRDGRIITFYSYKGGTGRTMALANTAWILAANGYRVLAADWDLEAPGLGHFFRPFLDPDALAGTTGVIDLIMDYRDEALRDLPRADGWHREFTRVRQHALSLAWPHFPADGTLDFLSAGQVRSDYAATVAAINWDHFYERLDGGRFFAALRADMRRHYDYVLIDSRTGLSDIADICTVEMPDDLVVCFTLSDQSIEGASEIARTISEHYPGRGIRILPVPMRVDDGEKEKADAGRALARQRFDGFPQGFDEARLARYWGAVEIPYRAYYAYEEVLAPFGDQPGTPTSLLSSFERLTEALTDGRVVGLPPMPEDRRLHFAGSFTRRRPVVREDVVLSFVPEDLMWADWITSLLERAGLRVFPQEVGRGLEDGPERAARTLVLLSAAYVRSPEAEVRGFAGGTDPGGTRRELLPVRVGEVRLPAQFSGAVDLRRLTEEQAAEALLRALRRPDAERRPVVDGPRYPGNRPQIWNVRLRNPAFTGRSAMLGAMRDGLRESGIAALYGLGGVGKTQLALEYVHRFMADYDLVWWIEASKPEQVAQSLAELAHRLDRRLGDNVAEAAETAREALRKDLGTGRWLLVFDNADRPDEVARFLPDGPGHVLITSRNQAWSDRADPLSVDVFTRRESIDHLRRRRTGLSPVDADRVAEAVGDLPLAVEIAAAWLETTGTPVASYVAELRLQAVKALSAAQETPEYPLRFGATWNVSIARLREQSPAAHRLLRLCAYFSAEPISLDLVYGEQMARCLMEFDQDLQERALLGREVRAITRYGLAKVDSTTGTFQVHRMVQAAVQAEMTAEEQERAMHDVHLVLAGARPPGDVDDWSNWPEFENIWPHLRASRAQDCEEAEVRQLLVDRVRYLWRRGELPAAEDLGRQLDRDWTDRRGSDDRQTLLLRCQLANVVRSQGQFEEAMALDLDTLERQRALHGPEHPYTLMTGIGLGADLRALGRFREALELDRQTCATIRDLFGEEYPQAMFAAHGLALDHRLNGDYEAAAELDRETLDKRVAVLGPQHPDTLASMAALAEDLWALGDYRASMQLLDQVSADYSASPVTDLPLLRYAKSRAVVLRRVGRSAEARQLSTSTYERCAERYGALAPDSLACALNLAADCSATGDPQAARELASEVYQGFRDSLGDTHPFALACANNLGLYQRVCGATAEATVLGEATLVSMRRVLGPEHPFTLAATVNLADCHADGGDLVRAEELGREALAGLVGRYGAQHLDALVCEANLAVTLRDLGRREEAVALRARVVEELTRQLGDEHPLTRNVRGWRRSGIDLELQPV